MLSRTITSASWSRVATWYESGSTTSSASVDETCVEDVRGVRWLDDVVLGAAEQQQGLRHLGDVGLDRSSTAADSEYAAFSGMLVVGALVLAGLGDVVRDAGEAGDEALEDRQQMRSGRSVCTAGLTRTMPAIASPCSSASRRVSEPPIDRPMTNTVVAARSELAQVPARPRRTSPPTSSGSCPATWCRGPGAGAPGRSSPAGERLGPRASWTCGDPVNPWSTRMPTSLPSADQGSAPGTTGMGVLSQRGRLTAVDPPTSLPPGRRRADAVLVPEVHRRRTVAARALPALGRGPRPRPRQGRRDPREQPPVLLRLLLPAARRAAAHHLPGQERLLHRPGHQGLLHEDVLRRRGPGARGPLRRPGLRGRPAHGPAHPRRGQPAGHLPRGHALPERHALPRQDRASPAWRWRPRCRSCRWR